MVSLSLVLLEHVIASFLKSFVLLTICCLLTPPRSEMISIKAHLEDHAHTTRREAVMACFVKTLTPEAVKDIEIGNPFLRMKIFVLSGVESKALTLDDVPQFYRPYPGCLFDVLSEPDNEKRREEMKKFFSQLSTEGCPTRQYGLLYTVMHFWKAIFIISTSQPPKRNHLRTFYWLTEAGLFQCLMRILSLCLHPEFLAVEYNRYLAVRVMEAMFGAMQAETVSGNDVMTNIVEDEEVAVATFIALLEGKLTFAEQIMAQQVVGNFSCFPRGMIFLTDAPELSGVAGKFLWCSYDVCWIHYGQYDERRMTWLRHLMNTDIVLDASVNKMYLAGPKRSAHMCVYSALCAMCNICAGYPDECSMDHVDRCLIAMVKLGYYWNLGSVATGIILARPRYSELTIDKFLSLTGWSAFNATNQKMIVEQINSLAITRKEKPLCFNPKSKCRAMSVIAFFITHSLWLDFDQGSHFAVLGLVHMLKGGLAEVGRAVVENIGDQLFDLSHSIHHVKMPDGEPMSIKRGIMEPIFNFCGIYYFTEQGEMVTNHQPVYKKYEWPKPVVDMREFSLRHIREDKLSREERERRVLVSECIKAEGNKFYEAGELESAIDAYSQALEICPLKCAEKRVIYYSNRGECYLQTNQPRKALSDCNRALAMNSYNMKVRWRRAQAYKKIGCDYGAALDLLTMERKKEDALRVMGKKMFAELEMTISCLLEHRTFQVSAIQKYGTSLHSDTVQKTAGLQSYELAKTIVPPFRAKSTRELMGQSPGGFELEIEEEGGGGGKRVSATKTWAERRAREGGEGGEVEEVEEDELIQRRIDLNLRWLKRDEKYLKSKEKVSNERNLLKERAQLLGDKSVDEASLLVKNEEK